MNARELHDKVRDEAERIADELDPDEDWAAVAFVDTPNELMIVALDFGGEIEKAAIYEVVLPTIVIENHATAVATVNTVWLVETEGSFPDVRASQHPDREEALVVMAFDWEDAVTSIAKIRRGGSHPELEPWIDADATREGRIPESILNALATVRRSGNGT